PGQLLTFSVRAVGLRNVTRIGMQLRGAMTRDTIVTVPVPSTDVVQPISFAVPPTVSDTLLNVTIFAIDERNQIGASQTLTLPVGITPPSVVLTAAPDSVQAGRVLDLRVTAAG